MKNDECIQLSVLMPVLRTELFRLEVTPTDVLLIDRMNKQYVKTTPAELAKAASRNIRYADLQKLIVEASKPNGKSEVTGTELGFPGMDKAKARLYDFSDKEFELARTAIPSRYTQITLDQLANMLPEQ